MVITIQDSILREIAQALVNKETPTAELAAMADICEEEGRATAHVWRDALAGHCQLEGWTVLLGSEIVPHIVAVYSSPEWRLWSRGDQGGGVCHTSSRENDWQDWNCEGVIPLTHAARE